MGKFKKPEVAVDGTKQDELSSARSSLSSGFDRPSSCLDGVKHGVVPAISAVKAWTVTLDKLQRTAVTVAIVGLLATLVQTASTVDRTPDNCRTVDTYGASNLMTYSGPVTRQWYPCNSDNDETTADGNNYVERVEGSIPWQEVLEHLLKG